MTNLENVSESTEITPTEDPKFDDYITQLEKEFNSSKLTEAEAVVAKFELDEVNGSKEIETKEVKEENVPETSALERVANKENEHKEIVSKFEAEKAEFTKAKAQWDTERKTLVSPQDILEMVSLEPDKFFERLGVDTDSIMKQLLFSKMADTNPAKAKLKVELRDLDTKREIKKLKEQLMNKEAEVSKAETYNKTYSGAGEYAKSVVEGERASKFPTVSQVAKADQSWVHARIMKEIISDATYRLARGESGDPISYDEAANRMEADLSALAKYLVKHEIAAETKEQKAAINPTNSTIKPPPPVRKKRELTSEEQDEYYIAQAVAYAEKLKAQERG